MSHIAINAVHANSAAMISFVSSFFLILFAYFFVIASLYTNNNIVHFRICSVL